MNRSENGWPTRHHSVDVVLKKFAPSDLARRYHSGMEVFVQVEQGKGEQVFKATNTPVPNTYNDGEFQYYSFRIQSEDDVTANISYPLELYFSSIGISGWDIVNKVARGCGFDFDSILNHDEARGLTVEQLSDLLAALRKLPYVEIRRSTSGSGYHVWVWFPEHDLPQVKDRTQMKALARAVLQRMALDTGHNFTADVDHLGDILWICSGRATPENGGLSLVQSAQQHLHDWPRNFLDQVDVVTRKRSRSRIAGTSDAESDRIDVATNDRPRVQPDAKHRKFLAAYYETEFLGQWNQDHGCFTCHTSGIAMVVEKLSVPGFFKTVSKGKNPTEPNCWMYPLEDGGWRVFRFEKGTKEAPTWETSRSGWTTCVFGLKPTLRDVAAVYKGINRGKGYAFLSVENATKAIKALGETVEFPAWMKDAGRPVTIMLGKQGIEMELPLDKGDDRQESNRSGWFKKGLLWHKFIESDAKGQHADYHSLADQVVRVVSHNGEQTGIFVSTGDSWTKETADLVKSRLTLEGITGGLQVELLGWCGKNPFIRVARPFEPEFPGDRQWNVDGAKLLFSPAAESGVTESWDKILEHLGRGLDDAVEVDCWCAQHGIMCGADYLRYWYANMIRQPERRLPMLAVYSAENNTGKSLLHEAPAVLFDEQGYSFAAKAIKNKSGFDSELHGRVLCALEEIDLSQSPDFYANLKKLITSHRADFTYKGEDTFMDVNYSHWVMTTNSSSFIPLEPADQRIILWEVPPFEGKEIPKATLLEDLRKEAPYFLRRLFDLDISEVYGRVTLPVLMTAEKANLIKMARIQADFPNLDGVALKAAEALKAMERPWGPGPAMQLNDVLGNWDGEQGKKTPKSRANSLGRYMAQIKPHLAAHNIKLEIGHNGKTSLYTLSA
jgi:hypothetical protein